MPSIAAMLTSARAIAGFYNTSNNFVEALDQAQIEVFILS